MEIDICFHNLKQGSIPMKGSIIPHPPRRQFGSYGQLPMPFSLLNQDSSPLFSGHTSFVVPPGAGAVIVQECCFYLFTLGK